MNFRLPVIILTLLACGASIAAAESLLSGGAWKRNGFATERFEINGTDTRNNPLRRKLPAPFAGDELFVRYRLRYDASTIDTPAEDEGEFFVLWLDASEGGDSATHSGGVPNLGIHVSKEENRFMARYSSGGEKFGRKLEGDRDFLVVGRLWKSSRGEKESFDQFDLWIDPSSGAEFSPDASAKSAKSIAAVRWIGFSTGAKTEADDRIEVWDVDLAESWESILGLPPKPGEPAPAEVAVVEKTINFREHVFPLLESRCFKCHEGEEAKDDVRLDVLDEVLNRTTPRNAAASRLFELAASGEMPPEGKGEPLDKEELATLRAWIDEGLDWDEELLPTPVPETDHWAFQPIRRPDLPRVRDKDWIRTPVDAFIAAKHEASGLAPAPEADRETLARRMSLGMLGLPPGNGHRASGNEDPASRIDALLASPAYGERWGRHWLDVARWAESNGHQHNRDRPHAWRYRDYVIDAFNGDKPFDDFLREQIAGDEIEPYRDENLVATGFLAATRYSGNELDKDIQRNDILVDILNTTAKAFLGLTVECAQCHTHKFDPISIRDYYRLQAFFAQGQPGNILFGGNGEAAKALVDERWRIFDSVHARLVAVKRRQGHPEPVYVIPKSVAAGMKPDERKRFNELNERIAKLPQSWSFYSPATSGRNLVVAPHEMRWPLSRDPRVLESMRTNLLIRGDVKSRGPEVLPGWPVVFGPAPDTETRPRTALADWMTSPGNPLTARVWVNRIWQWHFGRGLVESSGDFGTKGAAPSHPALLDFLASELMGNGWSTKHIHRLILDSATYRQSSRFSDANAAIDPGNTALWRWTPRRLEAEAIRDSVLAVSGLLDAKRGGPSATADSTRRSIYLKQRRDHFPDQQMLFDSATGIVSCSRRRVSTTSLQPLWLMNSGFVHEAARAFAGKAGSVREVARLALGRAPDPAEVAELEQLAAEFGLESAAVAIFNSSEFLYIP